MLEHLDTDDYIAEEISYSISFTLISNDWPLLCADYLLIHNHVDLEVLLSELPTMMIPNCCTAIYFRLYIAVTLVIIHSSVIQLLPVSARFDIFIAELLRVRTLVHVKLLQFELPTVLFSKL